MTDENENRLDPQTADETLTQWVPADRPATEPPGATEEPGGWFPPAPAEQPTWANWDQPWDPSDEPFDQAAVARTPPVDPPFRAHEAPAGPPPASQPDPMAGSAPPSAAETAHTGSWANLHALRVLAQVACPLLLLVGLTFSDNDAQSGWHAYPAWAVFAAVCAVIQLAPLVGRSLGLTAENAWFLAAVGTAGLVGYWVIIVLPAVSSNTGFAQTLAAGFAVIGLWLSPGRRG